MRCNTCGTEFPDGQGVCPVCGAYANAGQPEQAQQPYPGQVQQPYPNEVQQPYPGQMQQPYQGYAYPQGQQPYPGQVQQPYPAPAQQPYPAMPNTPEPSSKEKKKGKGSKKKIIIGSIVAVTVLAAAAVLLILFVFKGSDAYFVYHGEKYAFSEEVGVEGIEKIEGGLRFEKERDGRKVVYGRLTENGVVDETDQPNNGIAMSSMNVYGMWLFLRAVNVSGHEIWKDADGTTRGKGLTGLSFAIYDEPDKAFPQFSSDNNNVFYYDYGDGYSFDSAFLRAGKAISTDYVDDDYQKLIDCYKSYGGQNDFRAACQESQNRQEAYFEPLMKWCDDPDYKSFLLNYRHIINPNDKSVDYDKELYNKAAVTAGMTRCKLAGEVLSGKIPYFVEISHPTGSKPGYPVSFVIYAKNETLIKWMQNYGIPASVYENKLLDN